MSIKNDDGLNTLNQIPTSAPIQEETKNYGTPYKCPVCGGKGIVPHGFYTCNSFGNRDYTMLAGNASPEQCRSCNGKGIIWG